MHTELQEVQAVVNSVPLPEEARHTADWCLAQLPELYGRLEQTSDARYMDEIRRLVQGLLVALKAIPAAPARRAAEAVTLRFVAMHERLGIPSLDLKPPRRRKVG
jgi:hypothetical protein